MDTLYNREKNNILRLNEGSNKLVKQLETIERSLGLINPEKRISKSLRATYFKIMNIERTNEFEGAELSRNYGEALKNFNEQLDDGVKTITDYYKKMAKISRILSKLKTSNGKILEEMDIDGDIVDVGIALYDGLHNAIKTTYEELRDFVKLIIEPDKFDEIWASVGQELMKIIKDPYQFVQTLVEGMKDELGDLLRDIEVIENNSTQIGYIIVLSGLITQVGVSKFLEQVGPGKFLAIMGIADKWGLNKLWKKEGGKPMKENKPDDTQKEKVDIVDMKGKYMLDDSISPTDASNKIGEYAEYFDVKYFLGDSEKKEAIWKYWIVYESI